MCFFTITNCASTYLQFDAGCTTIHNLCFQTCFWSSHLFVVVHFMSLSYAAVFCLFDSGSGLVLNTALSGKKYVKYTDTYSSGSTIIYIEVW